ncbi:MAG: acyl-CoA thioesterase [Flavobacteriales bacterium]|nr:acyl-CoA thioesterase [Flavobacteriales bacterium]
MLPSYSNFRGKIHGGYILSMLDEIAFACASRHSGTYCVTASVDTVNFLNPIEIGELVTMKASINFAGRTSMIVGIRVVSENIQTGEEKHCNSSYFTMVAKDENGNPDQVPGLILESEKDVRRYLRSIQMIEDRKNRKQYKERELSITVDELKDRLDSFKVKLNQEHLAGFLK